MHTIEGEIINMRHKDLPILTCFTHPTYGREVDIQSIERKAIRWLRELLDDYGPRDLINLAISKDHKNVETHTTQQTVRRINQQLSKNLGKDAGVWRFTGFDVYGDPSYYWRAP